MGPHACKVAGNIVVRIFPVRIFADPSCRGPDLYNYGHMVGTIAPGELPFTALVCKRAAARLASCMWRPLRAPARWCAALPTAAAVKGGAEGTTSHLQTAQPTCPSESDAPHLQQLSSCISMPSPRCPRGSALPTTGGLEGAVDDAIPAGGASVEPPRCHPACGAAHVALTKPRPPRPGLWRHCGTPAYA